MVLVLVQAGESCATANQQDQAVSWVVGDVVVVAVWSPRWWWLL
jgi:hypothetical protein